MSGTPTMPSTTADEALLHEFDAVEWFDVCRRLQPDLTQERFDELWNAFQKDKSERQRLSRLQ